jgi:hypothetical protein
MRTAMKIRPTAETIISLAIAAAIALATAGTCQAQATTKPGDPNTFVSKKDGFSISVPDTWDRAEDVKGVSVIFKQPMTDASDTTSENVIVAAETLPADITLERYVKPTMVGLSKLKEFKTVSSTGVKLGKNDARRIVYQHNAREMNLKVLLYIIVSGGRGYLLTCISSLEQYASHEKVFEDICKTFKTFEADAPKPHPFRSEKDGFSIAGPAGWDKRENQMGTAVIFVQPLTSQSDTYRENVSVVIAEVPSSVGLDACVEVNVAYMVKRLKEFKLLSSVPAKLGKNNAKRMMYQEKKGDYDLKCLAYIIAANERAYIMTCTATIDQYDNHETVFEDTCKTFQTFEPAKAGAKDDKKDGTKTSPNSL